MLKKYQHYWINLITSELSTDYICIPCFYTDCSFAIHAQNAIYKNNKYRIYKDHCVPYNPRINALIKKHPYKFNEYDYLKNTIYKELLKQSLHVIVTKLEYEILPNGAVKAQIHFESPITLFHIDQLLIDAFRKVIAAHLTISKITYIIKTRTNQSTKNNYFIYELSCG